MSFINHYVLEERTAVDRLEALWLGHVQRMVEDVVAMLFPETPVRCVVGIRQVTDPAELRKLHLSLLKASSQAEAERILAQISKRTAR